MPTVAACRLRDGPRVNGSYTPTGQIALADDPELTVVAEWDGGAAQQGGQAIAGRCVVVDRLGWANRCRPLPELVELDPGEPEFLLGQVRGQPVDRLAGARRMPMGATMGWPAPRSAPTTMNRLRVHTDRLRAPRAPQGAGTLHGDRPARWLAVPLRGRATYRAGPQGGMSPARLGNRQTAPGPGGWRCSPTCTPIWTSCCSP
jgi:hypothetical protein